MEEIQERQVNQKVLSNGAIYDLDKKRIVSGAALSSDGARALVQKREESRRAVVRDVANSAAAASDYRGAHGDLAYLAAITNAAMTKATNPADPKMIEAANWLQRAAGDVDEPGSGGDSGVEELRGLVRDLAELARAVAAVNPVEANNNYLQP